MIGEILGKVLIVVKADTAQAKAMIKDLSDAEQKAARERIEAQEKVNNAWDNALKKHALVVAGVTAGIAIAIASVKKYEEHLKEMGDTGSGEFQRIARAGEAAQKAQDNLQIALGRLAVAATPVVEALAQMAMELGNIADGVGRVIRGATSLIPGGSGTAKFVGKWAGRSVFGAAGLGYGLYQDYLSTPDQYIADTNGAVGSEYEGVSYQEEGRETVSPELAKALGWKYISGPDGGYWRPLTEDEKRERDRKRKEGARAGARQRDIYADAWRKIQGEIDATSGNAAGAGYSANHWGDLSDADLLGLAGESAKGGDFKQFGDYESTTLAALEESIKAAQQITAAVDQRETMLAKIFGPVSEFELYTTAWQGLESVVSAGLNAWITGSKSAGEAMKEALHGFAKQLAGEAMLQALRHTAYGIGSLAIGGPLAGASAGAHFKAAATWGAVAVAAAAVGRASAPSAAGGAAGARAAAGIGTGGGARGGEPMQLTVVMGDGMSDASPRHVARRTRHNINLARRYANTDGAVPG